MPSEEYLAARQKVAEAKKQMQELVKSTFNDEAQAVLAEIGAESFGWTQYTPYFNDGDECVFSVHYDPDSVEINGRDSYGYSRLGDEEEEEEEEERAYPDWKLREIDPEEYQRQLKAYYGNHGVVAEFLQGYTEEDLKFMFGDHVYVQVTRDGIEVEDYEHD